jgi:hypothetical protein
MCSSRPFLWVAITARNTLGFKGFFLQQMPLYRVAMVAGIHCVCADPKVKIEVLDERRKFVEVDKILEMTSFGK